MAFIFARLWGRRLTAAFSAALLTTVMLIAALFFASCKISGASKDIAARPANLTITPDSQYLLPGGNTSFNVKFGEETIESEQVKLNVSGELDSNTKIKDGKLLVGTGQAAGNLSISGTYQAPDAKSVNGTAVVKVINPSTKSIKEKFGVDATGKDGVEAAFKELHAFIQNGGLKKDAAEDPNKRVIKVGDWIDLEGGLTVAAHGAGDNTGGFSYSYNDEAWNANITVNENDQGKLSRLIVVGINSFHSSGTEGGYKYPKKEGETDPPQHVVFQFQNIPVSRRMNPPVEDYPISTNTGGYPASEMRDYLTKNFLTGLIKTAGVPEGVLWAPARLLSARAKHDKKESSSPAKIRDMLWLPTEWDIFGMQTNSIGADETAANQARFEYYVVPISRKKLDASKNTAPYWLASTYYDNKSSFCAVSGTGDSSYKSASTAPPPGVAPAFCVY
ncbi:MAG: hypothetical protein LBK66_03530 [Spirochaetaceae bacterium]|jgi:hypothetical protein|nr:hypothetical protein [Spirochaetaceae bacterium]